MAEEERVDTIVTDVLTNPGIVIDPVLGLIRVNASGRHPIAAGRGDYKLNGLGILAENYDPTFGITGATLATQAVFGEAVALNQGDVITNLGALVTVAAAGTLPTTVRLGLLDSTGKVLALTGNVNALANFALGFQLYPLTAAYTVTATGMYYIAIVKNGTFGTTEPQVATVTGIDVTGSAGFTAFRRAWTWAGQTDLPAVAASATITTGTTLRRYLAAIGTPLQN